MKNWRRLLYWIGILIGGCLFAYQFVVIVPQLQITSNVFVKPSYVGLTLACVALATVLQIFTWSKIIIALDVKLSIRELYPAYVLPFLARYLPGSIWGYVGRSLWLKQHYGVSERLTTASTILELGSLIISTGIILTPIYIMNIMENITILTALLIFCLVITSGLVMLILEKSKQLGFLSLRNPKATVIKLVIALCIHCVFWLIQGLGLYFILKAFYENPIWGPLEITRVFVISWLAGFLVPFIPAGLGVRDLALSNLLINLGVDIYVASLVAILSRAVALIVELVFVAFAFIFSKTGLVELHNR